MIVYDGHPRLKGRHHSVTPRSVVRHLFSIPNDTVCNNSLLMRVPAPLPFAAAVINLVVTMRYYLTTFLSYFRDRGK
ncbi:hypothetical protein JTE90_027330 [Oedothorax gibbosus]|uniref:Uncharacterized protein n=1 Tax=Oedothorax gibbosus TaxID=931172 RepID=A0AAV6VZG9_9ARAC|nr:hypothetical protein JTE90_027330 [Oedothorax gibbosus]